MISLRSTVRAGALAVAATLLLGCTNSVTTYNFRQYHDRWPELIGWQTARPIEVVVWGNPFDAAKATVDAAVVDSLSRRALRPGSLLHVHSERERHRQPGSLRGP